MTLTPIRPARVSKSNLEPVVVDHFPDAAEGFDHATAEAVFSTIMKMDTDEAVAFGTFIVGASMIHDCLVHQTELAKAAHEQMLARATGLTSELTRKAIAKARAGEDAEPELAAVEMLAKAFDSQAFSPQARAERARNQHRDLLTGRFKVDHHAVHTLLDKPAPDAIASKLGVPKVDGLNSKQKAQFQDAYHQVAQFIAPYTQLPAGEGFLHLTYDTGEEEVHPLPSGGQRLGHGANGLDPKRRLIGADVSVVPSADAPGGAFSTFNAVGLPRTGAVAAGSFNGGVLDPDTVSSFGDDWNRQVDADTFNPANRVFRRLGAGSKLLDDTLGNAAPAKLRIALKVGQHVGELGPEAQKVIGPTADRAAYRYRGTERQPDARLVASIDAVRSDPRFGSANRRDLLIHGAETDSGWNPSPVLNYFRGRLPKAELNTLQRKSGTIPPSEGIIFDKNGKVVTQAVGYGDDHYLPFNLRNLAKLRGGEYVRTRSFGGPTTEDLYTGLMSGARAITVASHNGVYTLEFDPSFKGGRRYNDKAARMVARYGQLLDAVKSGQVTAPIDASRMEELATQADREVGGEERDPEGYRRELDRLVTRERKNPTLSRAQAGAAAADFFNQQAVKMGDSVGRHMSPEEMARSWAATDTTAAYRQYNNGYIEMTRARDQFIQTHPGEQPPPLPPRRSQDDFINERLDGLRSDDPVTAARNLADAMGLRPQFNAHMKAAEEANKAALKPLTLNGGGYQVALTALQEQFPYYLRPPVYHPWAEGGAPNATDTGYVMPRHNRPAAALAGYFATELGGKVRAHTIRGQNGRATPVPYVARSGTATPDAPRRPSAATAAAAAESTEVDPEVAAQLKVQAARDLVANIKAQDRFSNGVLNPQAAQAIANQPVADFLDGVWLNGVPNIKHFLTTDDATLERERAANPQAYSAKLSRALDENEKHGLLDLDVNVVRAHRNGGLPDPVKTITNNAAAHLNDAPGTEYNFGDSAIFAEGHRASESEIASAYINDPRIKELIDAHELPPHPSDGAAFTTEAAALRRKLQADQTARLRWSVNTKARGPEPVKEHELNRRAEGLLRAEQLRRRYLEAQKANTVVVQAAPEPVTETHYHFGDNFDPSNFTGLPGTSN